MRRLTALASVACIFAASSGAARAEAGRTEPISVGRIERLIAAKGAKAAVAQLNESSEYEDVLDQIGWGKGEWIALAPRLVPGVDASDAEELDIRLADALPRNPTAVLRVLHLNSESVLLRVDHVCSSPFVYRSLASYAAYKRRPIRAVSRVRDPALKARQEKCFARLRS